MIEIRLLILFMLLLSGCSPRKESRINRNQLSDTLNMVSYAHGFSIVRNGKNIMLTVSNPWQHASGIQYRYILSDTINRSHAVDEFTWAVKTPVRNVICLSTTHIGLISFIGKTGTITGISGKNFIVNDTVRKGIAENRIYDVGYDEGLDYELILRIKPDVVFAYGVSVSVTNTIRKLNELGIPVILIGEYLEEEPLGKMEWVKAFAACYDLGEQVSVRFDSVASRYRELAELASVSEIKPAVLLGLPWRGNWYVSGARSYIAQLITNAGGNYIWNDLDFNESRPLGLEKIYEKALTADLWINPGEARSKQDIISVDPRFGNLPALLNDRVYNNDNRMSSSGGNDFFEAGVVEPDIILSDLIAILQPHLLPSHKLKYYRRLQ